MRVQQIDILALAAHPDDIELACGGTLIRAVDQGQRIGMIDLTRGEMGTRGTPQIRAAEAEEAMRRLGAAFRIQLDFGDGGLRSGRDQELELIRVIRDARPAVILAPFPEDRHPDHARAGRVVTDAAFYSGLAKIDTGQPRHRPHSVIYFMQAHVRPPSFIVDISATFERKMHAVSAHKSQFHNPDSTEPLTRIAHKNFLAMIEGRARHYGFMIGADYGEPFVTLVPPRVDDLIAAFHGREIS